MGVGGDKIRVASVRSPSSPVAKPTGRVARSFTGAHETSAHEVPACVAGVHAGPLC